MAKMNRRDFLKLAGVAAPLAGLGAYELTHNARVPLPTGSFGPQTADAARLPPGVRAVSHHEVMHSIRRRPFPSMRSRAYVRAEANKPPFDLLLHQPERVMSHRGVLEVDLVARFADPDEVIVGGLPLTVRTYDGRLPGRTLVAKPGDVLKIRHINQLPASVPPSDDFAHPLDENIPHGFNVLNLHTHGLNVSPEGNEDNVLVQVHPGETFEYEIRIPEDHPTGTFWYHPHKHGSAFVHLASGMAGHLLIVGRGDLSDIREIAVAREVELLFQELCINENFEVSNQPLRSLFGLDSPSSFLQLTVNGLAIDEGVDPDTGLGGVPPVLKMRPGEVQRWRFSMTTHLQTYLFALQDHSLHIAARDGITQDALESVDSIEMAPANRIDVLVKASDTPGVYPFKMLPTPFGENPFFTTPQGADIVFNVVVEGSPKDMLLPARLNPPRQRLPYIRGNEIVRRRQIDFSVTGAVLFDNMNAVIGDTREFFINTRKFSSRRIDQVMELETAEEWTLTNDPHTNISSINHPFHIHVNWFQVMEILHSDGSIENPNAPFGRWQETIDIPFGGYVIIRHRFENFPGKFPFHCHVLEHEDTGMMSLVEVLDTHPVRVKILPGTGGVLVSNDFDNRIIVRVPPNAIDQVTEFSLTHRVEPPIKLQGLLSLQRLFVLRVLPVYWRPPTSVLISIQYPREIPDAQFNEDTVRLYRWNGTKWTSEGISVVARMDGLLVCATNALGQFAVLAEPQ